MATNYWENRLKQRTSSKKSRPAVSPKLPDITGGQTFKDISSEIKNLRDISRTGGQESSAIRNELARLRGKQSGLDSEQRAFLSKYKTELDKYLTEGTKAIKDSVGGLKQRTKKLTETEGIGEFDNFIEALKASNLRLQGISKEQQKTAGQTLKERDSYLRKFDALLRGEIGQGPSKVEAAAKQKRARDLRTQAQMLNALSRGGGAGSVRDYLSRVESADIDTLQETAAARASEYYQRRSQLQKELSAQAIAENYYNTIASQQLAGASQSQASVSQTYANILSSLASKQQLEQDLFFNEASQLNTLLKTQTGALGTYGQLGAGILGNIGQRGLQTAQTAIGAYDQILGRRIQAGLGAGQLGTGLLGAIQQQSQNAWQRYVNERDFNELQFQDRRNFETAQEQTQFQRNQNINNAQSLRELLQGIKGRR